jgi:hypothetical protein
MTLAQALDLVVARTGHDRYRWLCSAANPDAEQREAYRRLVLDLADGKLPPPRPVALRAEAEPIRWAPLGGCCGG